MELNDLLPVTLLYTATPTLSGILIAYSIIATVLGALLWTGKSVPDDVGLAVTASGLTTGVLVVLGLIFVHVVLNWF